MRGGGSQRATWRLIRVQLSLERWPRRRSAAHESRTRWKRNVASASLLPGTPYLILNGQLDWDSEFDAPMYTPDVPATADARRWHPDDALLVPLRGREGELAGIMWLDGPLDGLSGGAIKNCSLSAAWITTGSWCRCASPAGSCSA